MVVFFALCLLCCFFGVLFFRMCLEAHRQKSESLGLACLGVFVALMVLVAATVFKGQELTPLAEVQFLKQIGR